MTTDIQCPTCKENNTWRKDNPFKPFCSDRCKLIDLGDWASEKNSIPGEEATDWDDNNHSNQ